MNILQTIHLHGFIEEGYDGISFDNSYSNIAMDIARSLNVYFEDSKHQPEDTYKTKESHYIPRVSVRMYFSENEISLEEVTEKVILNALGALDIYTEWYGYSEWTIEGYNVVNFTIGNHDLEAILENYIGKYVHVVVDIFE